ncbi:hypothetical protein H4Q32_002120 [Labeo rohita]|uniref:Uncharacterized protein n=1 Tax=Labeo rohita TaxID=84645 RepID=A0ABQ8MMD3_LABRO|nr:hypothetical protein H4Q32_002120 [Labeo rohita]
MTSKIEEFVTAPSEDLLNNFTKDQLIELAGHYEINLVSQDKRLKDNVKLLIKTELTEGGILASQPSENLSNLVDATSTMSHLTFEQQKQLLLIQNEMKEKMLEVRSRVEMSKLQFQQQQLDVERYRLDLIKEGKLFLSGGVEHSGERSMASTATGHWKNECPSLKVKDVAKTKSKSLPSVKPVAFVVTTSEVDNIQKSCSSVGSAFSPFVTDGSVRLVTSTEAVSVKVLRDTGSAETFVLESVLAFSNDSYTGNNVLIRGIGLNVISVPIHKIVLHPDLIQGEVEVAVRSCLPVEV